MTWAQAEQIAYAMASMATAVAIVSVCTLYAALWTISGTQNW